MEGNIDNALVDKYLKGDEKALEFIISKYLGPIYRFVFGYVKSRTDAEDITQEIFLKAWRNLKKYDRNRNFKTWLFCIAKNTCLDFLKKKTTIPFSYFENANGQNVLAETLAHPSPLPKEILEQQDLVNFALNKLSTKYRDLLSLRYNQQFTFREIAETLQEPIHTIKSRHRRALIKLKKIIPE